MCVSQMIKGFGHVIYLDFTADRFSRFVYMYVCLDACVYFLQKHVMYMCMVCYHIYSCFYYIY